MSILKPYGTVFAILQRALDALLVAGSLFVASFALDRQWDLLHAGLWLAATAIFLLLGEGTRLYGSWRLRSIDEEFKAVFGVWAATCTALVVIAFLSKLSASFSRLETVSWFLMTPLFLVYSRLAVRLWLRWLRRMGNNRRTVAIAGASTVADAMAQHLKESAGFGMWVTGVYDDRSRDRIQTEGGTSLSILGTLSELVEEARKGAIDYVFIALPMRAEKRVVELTNRLADTTASVYVIPDLFVFDLMRARWTTLGSLPVVSVYESPFDGLSGWVKRLEDLALGTVFLALAALPMTAIAIALKLTSRESVFFRQQRYGLNGRVVRIIKFRTMNVSEDGANVVQATRDDPRITPIGRFLRRTSLDELPQLLNVLAGDMSLVGPRPHAVKVNEDFRRLIHGYMLRHKVKPGITGWAQVNGWHGDDTVEKMQRRVEHDLRYVEDWSLWFDLKILAATVLGVLTRGSRAGA